MKIITKTRASYFIALLLGTIVSASAIAMAPLSDDEMSNVTGQALLMMDMREGEGISKDLNFYRAGLDAIVELNANFEKLQLGCGGVNGPGCDIDIDHLSLSGPDDCPVGRPGCDAILTRPFFEFAIDNDGTPHREIVGFRLSAEMAEGLLTAGQNDGTPNGINSLSGYMEIEETTGTTQTKPTPFNEPLTGRVTVGGCAYGCPRTYNTDLADIDLESKNVLFTVPAFTVNDRRVKNLNLQANADIPDIAISGTRSAEIPGCMGILLIPICNYSIETLNIKGVLSGLKTNISINESLGFLHKIPIQNPFSLSMQSQNIFWPESNESNIAQRGWWMAFSDPVKLGDLSTPPDYQVDISEAYPEVATKVSQFLHDEILSVALGDALGSMFTGTLNADVGVINLANYGAVQVNLENLPLGSAQDVTPNCWGSAAFC